MAASETTSHSRLLKAAVALGHVLKTIRFLTMLVYSSIYEKAKMGWVIKCHTSVKPLELKQTLPFLLASHHSVSVKVKFFSN